MRNMTVLKGTIALAFVAAAASPFAGQSQARVDVAALSAEVRNAERAFAKTMADRDHAAFVSWLSEEAIFVGPKTTFRGRQSVAEGWKRFYESTRAPFSWEPERVEVLDSGTLALSSGPVRDPQGKRIGTFNSVWRREPGGGWKIVLDNGCPPCDCR